MENIKSLTIEERLWGGLLGSAAGMGE